MKIAKLSVTPETIDDVLTNIILPITPTAALGTPASIKKKLLAQLAAFKKGLKGAPNRYVLVGCHDMELLAENDPRAEDCFDIFNTKKELEARFITKKANKHIWARYVFPKPINPETQLRYESFFSGFLHYYDTELRNGMSDHTIYCRWQKKVDKNTKINHDIVTVYLDPAPLRHKLNPNPGTNRTTKTPEEYANLMVEKNKEMKDTIFNPAWNPPGISGFQSDPPSPTGPPPPNP